MTITMREFVDALQRKNNRLNSTFQRLASEGADEATKDCCSGQITLLNSILLVLKENDRDELSKLSGLVNDSKGA